MTIPMKVRVVDLSRINDAAAEELAQLRAKHPDDDALMPYLVPSPMMGLVWFLSGTRLQYLFGGIEVIAELSDVIAAERFPTHTTGGHLHDWWIEDAPEPWRPQPDSG